jgi:drug/metabolite transporter (DMT)-like permease
MSSGTADHRWRAYAALAAAVLGMSWSAVFVRWAGVPGVASAFYRVLIASAILVPLWAGRGRTRSTDRRAMLLALGGGVFFAFDLALFNIAVLRTSAATAVLLGNSAPVFVGLATWLLFRRRPRARFWIGLALAFAGCASIVGTDALSGGSAGATEGDLIALAASVFWGAYMLTTEHVRADMDTLTFNTLAIAGSVITLFVVCLLAGVPLAGYSGRTWAALFALGLISQFAAYFAFVYALGHLPATLTSVANLAQIPLTALLAVPLLGEPVSRAQLAGGLLVLTGIYVVSKPQGAKTLEPKTLSAGS